MHHRQDMLRTHPTQPSDMDVIRRRIEHRFNRVPTGANRADASGLTRAAGLRRVGVGRPGGRGASSGPAARRRPAPTMAEEEPRMPADPMPAAQVDALLARAGLPLTEADRASLRAASRFVAAMTQRLREPAPPGIEAEPAATFAPAEPPR